MAQFVNQVKLTVLKGMQAIGQSASNLASNAQQRLQEMNLENQRREILSAFPLKAYEMWQKGEALPEALTDMLKELKDLDERLNLLKAQRFAKVEEKEAESGLKDAEEQPAEEAKEESAQAGLEENCEEAPAEESPSFEEPAPTDEGETGSND